MKIKLPSQSTLELIQLIVIIITVVYTLLYLAYFISFSLPNEITIFTVVLSPYDSNLYTSLLGALLTITAILFGFYLTILIPIIIKEERFLSVTYKHSKTGSYILRLFFLFLLFQPTYYYLFSVFDSVSLYPALTILQHAQATNSSLSSIYNGTSNSEKYYIGFYDNLSIIINNTRNETLINKSMPLLDYYKTKTTNLFNPILVNETSGIINSTNSVKSILSIFPYTSNRAINYMFYGAGFTFLNVIVYYIINWFQSTKFSKKRKEQKDEASINS